MVQTKYYPGQKKRSEYDFSAMQQGMQSQQSYCTLAMHSPNAHWLAVRPPNQTA